MEVNMFEKKIINKKNFIFCMNYDYIIDIIIYSYGYIYIC